MEIIPIVTSGVRSEAGGYAKVMTDTAVLNLVISSKLRVARFTSTLIILMIAMTFD